jgi:hypothetical protein
MSSSGVTICYLGDEEVLVGYVAYRAEPSVGLRHRYIENYWIENFDGSINHERSIALSVSEHEKILIRLEEHLADAE